jgi:TIGR03009 family protein
LAQQSQRAPSYAQQPPAQQQQQQPPAQQPSVAAEGQPVERIARQQNPPSAGQSSPSDASTGQPFAALGPAEQQQLHQFLLAWQQQSQGTKTLDCKFKRWHYDIKGAQANVHATKAEGVIRYAAPDKGLFRVDELVFYQGLVAGKPEYKTIDGQFGEHWICNGKQLIEMDRSKEECEIQDLPPEMQGQQIFNSPLPFVFNLDAAQILDRYWVRLVDINNPDVVLVEAWPKRQEDRAQYKLVQIGLDAKTFAPQALIMFAPNFDPKTAPNRDHYEFSDVKRNSVGAGLQQFIKNFIPEQPPKHWKIVRNKFTPVVDPPTAGEPTSPDAPISTAGR